MTNRKRPRGKKWTDAEGNDTYVGHPTRASRKARTKSKFRRSSRSKAR